MSDIVEKFIDNDLYSSPILYKLHTLPLHSTPNVNYTREDLLAKISMGDSKKMGNIVVTGVDGTFISQKLEDTIPETFTKHNVSEYFLKNTKGE